ncbi:MAG: hypothetical protein ACYDD1_10495 [Caulobacteraceae bacterium]
MSAVFSRSAVRPQRDWTPSRDALAGRGRVDVFDRPVETSDQLKLHLLSQITRLEQELATLRGRLRTLETSDQPAAEAPAPRRRNLTPRPALAPLILSILPAAGAMCSIDDIITGMLQAENIAVDDRPARSKAYRRANLCLHKLRAAGVIISHRIGSGRLDWGLNPDAPPTDDQSAG